MTWMTWRQHRAAATIGAVVLIVMATALVVLGVTTRAAVRHAGLTSCLRSGSDCTTVIDRLQHRYHWLPPVAASLFVLPLLAGMFWGAPLIARELETGTHRLVWTQSVSRRRWIGTKLALILGVTAAATLGLGLLAGWAFEPLIPVLGNRFRGGWFDVQGIIPTAYMLFALALGACMGALWRRTIPAMATTLVGFAVARIPIHTLRPHLVAAQVKTISTFIGDTPTGLAPGDWVLSQHPTGAATSGPPTTGPPAAIFRYIPAGKFWTLQATEAAIFLTFTAVLVAACITLVVRSRPQ